MGMNEGRKIKKKSGNDVGRSADFCMFCHSIGL